MRLIGIGRLHALAMSEDGPLAGAAASLRAELAGAQWASVQDVSKTYPNARYDGYRIEILLPVDHCAVVAVNYRAAVALVEYAGPQNARPSPNPRNVRKQA